MVACGVSTICDSSEFVIDKWLIGDILQQPPWIIGQNCNLPKIKQDLIHPVLMDDLVMVICHLNQPAHDCLMPKQ